MKHAEGRATNTLLEDVFGVQGRPAAAQEAIAALFTHIDQMDWDASSRRQDFLERHLGEDISDLARPEQ